MLSMAGSGGICCVGVCCVGIGIDCGTGKLVG